MTSRIYWGHITHSRREPAHSFTYPIFTFGIDLSDPSLPPSTFPLFGRNRSSMLSVHDRDYLGGKSASLLGGVRDHAGPDAHEIAATRLITMPRYFGYVFNPVSFFVNFRANKQIHSVLVEVHNTFGEAHLYALRAEGNGRTIRFDKRFFVSPFFDVEGEYTLSIDRCDEELDIRVVLSSGSDQSFSAQLSGKGIALTRLNLAKTLFRYPITSCLTMPRIHYEALRLWKRGAQIFEKPAPQCPMTFHSRQNGVHRARLDLLKRLNSRSVSSV